MSKTAVTSPELAPPVGPFSQAIEVGGFLYFSGQVGQDPATATVIPGPKSGCGKSRVHLPVQFECIGRSRSAWCAKAELSGR
jgi:2-iminobutanoate/2-iminopropanoate deaminase